MKKKSHIGLFFLEMMWMKAFICKPACKEKHADTAS